MGNSRKERQHQNRKLGIKKEEALDNVNAWGKSDPTPKKAVQSIIAKQRLIT